MSNGLQYIIGGTCTHLCGSAIHSPPLSHQRTATPPPSVFVPPCCQYIAVLGMSGLCVLKSVDNREAQEECVKQITDNCTKMIKKSFSHGLEAVSVGKKM